MNKARLSIGIIDLRVNNIFSVYRACLQAGFKTEIINLNKKKFNYDIVILPGVGAFKYGMEFLKKTHLNDRLYEYLEKPNSFVYGICLGMQLLFYKSYEFVETKGLKLIDGDVIKFSNTNTNVTHLGWNNFNIKDKNLKQDFKKFENKYFYFVHSYYAKPNFRKDVFASSQYGDKNFCSIVKRKNIFGTQFHPEKSGYLGIEFLQNIKKLK